MSNELGVSILKLHSLCDSCMPFCGVMKCVELRNVLLLLRKNVCHKSVANGKIAELSLNGIFC